MVRLFAATALLGLVLAAGAGASPASLVYLTVQVGAFDSTVTVDPPSPQPPVCSTTDCVFAYEYGTVVTLKALTGSLSPFVRWSGACSSAGSVPTCSGRLVGNTRVAASFSRLTVHYAAGKGGSVQRSPERGSCGEGCDVLRYQDTIVLRATADPGYHVDSWFGACSGGAWTKCTISSITRNYDVYVTFARNDGLGESTGPLGSGSLAKVGVSGQGTVSGQIGAEGFRCATGLLCKIYPNKGSAVAVTATATAGWKLSRWTGRCAGSATVCIFMNQPWPSSPVPSVQAIFVPA